MADKTAPRDHKAARRVSAAFLLLRFDDEDRRRLARLARLTYGRSSDAIEAELAGRLLSDVLTERIDMAERIAAVKHVKAVT